MTDVLPVKQDTKHLNPQDTSKPNTVDLRYPQILLQASFTSLLSSSFPSTSDIQANTMPDSEHSLSESWASLSEADYTPDEDARSETTGIVSLLGTNASEDSQAEEEHEQPREPEDHREQAAWETDEPVEQPTPIQTSVAQLRDAQPYDSTSTMGAPSPNAIKFVEAESWPIGVGRVDLMHSVKVFDAKEKARLWPGVGRDAQLNGTIRMTTSRGSIRRDRPFRLLYSGSPQAPETRAEILKKVGDVLVASSDIDARHNLEASRYHVIPSEFGPGSSPNYAELIPLQFQQMIVDECIKAEALEQDSAPRQIQLQYKGGQAILSSWDGTAYRVPKGSEWDPPDLAIIFVRESDDIARQVFSGLLNEFTSRHHIPTLVIRDDNDWSTTYIYIVPDRRSLRMCVESRATGLVQSVPIDLSSFINLDAGQLNRHIACLCAIYDQDASRQRIAIKLRQTQESRETSGDVEKNLSRSIVAQNRTKAFLVKHEVTINKAWQVSVVILLLVLGFSCCREFFVFVAAYFGGAASMTSNAPSTTTQSIQPVVSMITTTMIPTAMASISTTSLQVKPSAVGLRAPNVDKELARLVLEAAEIYNESAKFQVQILGDGHVVVKVPQRLLGKKKTPKLTICVRRGSVEVPSNTSKLFDGLYTVKIDREHANGLLNVTIVVKKPCITETYELDFGKPWIPTDRFKDALSQIWRPFSEQMEYLEQNPGIAFSNVLAATHGRLQSVSASGMAMIKNLTAQYGPSVRRISQEAQDKSQSLYSDVVCQAKAAAQAVSRESRLELQQLGTMSHIAGQQASRLAQKFFADVSTGMAYVRDRATHIDFEQVRDSFVRSETLAEAQERALKVAEDVATSLKSGREKFRARKAVRRKLRAEKKVKEEGKKAWHDNVRVNFLNFRL